MTPATQHRVVSRDEWLKARTALLTKEKEFTRLRDQLSAQKRALPWVRIDKEYIFDGPNGKVTLAGLFDGRKPALYQALHDGTGCLNAMRRLLLRGRSRGGNTCASSKP